MQPLLEYVLEHVSVKCESRLGVQIEVLFGDVDQMVLRRIAKTVDYLYGQSLLFF